jgi:hypothetical protein
VATLDLGDTTTLQFNATNQAGVATNPTSVVLTITLPDGSIITPAITNPPAQVGAFVYDYLTAQAGRHQVRWVGTGTVNQSYNDVFDVRAANPGMIFGLADAKDTLRIVAGTGNASDDKIRDYISAITNVIETLYGIVVQRSVTEQRRGGTDTISLSYRPVVSITSVTEYIAGVSYVGTQANDPAHSSTYGFTFDAQKGSIVRRNSAGLRMVFMDEVWITYLAGLTIIPDNVLMAARELLRFWWQFGQEGRSTSRNQSSEDVITVVGYAVPRRIIEMLGNTPLAPGFA